MAFTDLRAWLGFLEGKGELARIKAEVDWAEEIGALAREMTSREGPALLFENIKDYKEAPCRQVLTSPLGSRRRVRWCLGLPEDAPDGEVVRWLKDRFAERVTPSIVGSGPVKENIITGEEVDLFQLPVPLWNAMDGGRYICAGASIITQDPDTKELNVGTYRGMIADKDKIGVLLSRVQDWGKHFNKYAARGEEMPVAVVIGWDPTLFLTASTPVAGPEYEICGAVRGAPVELVKCETNDLLVPASAEIVIEGRISPDPQTFVREGPFGEYTGYYGGAESLKPAIKVDCITYRSDPIFCGVPEGTSPGRFVDESFWLKLSWAAVAWRVLEDAGVPGVTAVAGSPWPEILKVQIRKSFRGHAQLVANALWGSRYANYGAKILFVVDEDVDPYDPLALEWALAFRVNADMGAITFFPGTIGSMLDPSVPLEKRDIIKYGQGRWTRILIDATINWELEPQPQYGGQRYPPLGTQLSPAMRARLEQRWREYGLPLEL